jgi:glucose-1-phosphate cytidylyltransferase
MNVVILEGWINGGFMVLEPAIFDFLSDDRSNLEGRLDELAESGQLMAHRHYGFWQCMDTLRDKRYMKTRSGRPERPRGRAGAR